MILLEVEALINKSSATISNKPSTKKSSIKKYILPGTTAMALGLGLADYLTFNNPVVKKGRHILNEKIRDFVIKH
jgi:hypothetical protein